MNNDVNGYARDVTMTLLVIPAGCRAAGFLLIPNVDGGTAVDACESPLTDGRVIGWNHARSSRRSTCTCAH